MRWCRISLVLTFFILWCAVTSAVIAYPHPMNANDEMKPERPSAFTSVEEVQQYVNLLKQYYKNKVGGRYGKRSAMHPDLLRTYLLLLNNY